MTTAASMEPPINILIVDDEPRNLTVLESILDDPGYRLVRADNANKALLALVVEEFALLILDIRMPDMTGFELAQIIKARAKTSRVPIIFLTAFYNEDQHVLEGYDIGAVDYLHKPVNPAILRSKVAVFAELYRKNRANELAHVALLAEISERRFAEQRLRELNDSLERRVAERTEALREADRRKDEFLATLAHELRNPLAPVRNAVEILRLGGDATPQATWAREVIDRQTQQLARLLDDLMDVSRISHGKIELKREHVELSAVIQGAVETSRPHIDELGHELDISLPQLPVVLNADLTRLSQVFLNLLNNAIKYTERGGRIELRAELEGNEVMVAVRDTGIGIPDDKLPAIFEMFSQVDGASSRTAGGLGIGLSLVKRLVEMHGGRITASSGGLGKGSEFVVRLPIVTERPKIRRAHKAERSLPSSALRVLVVDDNRDSATSLSMLLSTMGNEVRTAYDGEEAVRVALEFRPQAVLCDIGLPKLGGYDVARAIRAEEWGKGAVLIAVTGWGQHADKQRSEAAGFDHHMVKPVDPADLMRILGALPNREHPREKPWNGAVYG
jgi:signal transduction histidine kinase